jgi:hypothetical protein
MLKGNNKMDLQEAEWGGVDWIGVAQDRNKWRAFVNTAMNFRVHKGWGISRLAEKLFPSQKGLCLMELGNLRDFTQFP